jgi:hypothetical protein
MNIRTKVATVGLLLCWTAPTQETGRQVIPKTWDDARLATLEIPVASLGAGKKHHVPAEYYYHVPIRPVYRTYPVYVPGREPAGYQEWLKQQDPKIVFDDAKPRTAREWIEDGKVVFHSPVAYDALVIESDVKDPNWYKLVRPPVAKDGAIPFLRYGIREKGKVEVGVLACGTCHSRLMPDGSVVDGFQGNFRYNSAIAWSYLVRGTPEFVHGDVKLIYGTPFMSPDPHAVMQGQSVDEIARHEEALPAGVIARNGASPYWPTQVPSLIGLQGRRYLDHTGIIQQRDIVDLMRYMALAQGLDFVSNYNGFIPNGEGDPPQLPDPLTLRAKRYSDEQLFALAMYIYSLKPPPNPNPSNDLSGKGKEIFAREACAGCHPAPLYSNNHLVPADGFTPPPEHLAKYSILPKSIGIDPGLTLRTRRGSGYYRVPSLRNVWAREMLGHSGYSKTLEDFFDPRRVRADYVPTGFRPNGDKPFPVKGHEFGLNLSAEDRTALIAFLRTL